MMNPYLPDTLNIPIIMMVHDDRIDRRVLDEARSLVQAGCKVKVIAAPPPKPGDRRDEEAYPEIEIIRVDPSVPAAPAPVPAGFETFASLNWRSLFYYTDHFYAEAVKFPAAVYVAHDLPQLVPALMAAAYHKSYVLYDAHELYPDQDYFIKTNQIGILTEIETWLAPFADQIITVNKSIAEFMTIRYKVTLPKVILNCPALHKNMQLPVPRTDVLREELGIGNEKKVLLYQGICALTRNLQGVIRAMSLIKNKEVVFVLMGPGFEKENELSKLANDLGLLNNRVYIRAAVDQTELLRYSASADAGIIPYPFTELNNYYCTPNKLFEFMVAGLPILANDLPELNRFVSQQGIGMNLPMSSPDEIASAIDMFFEQNVETFRTNAKSISAQYVWATQGEKLIQIYQAMLGSTPISNTLLINTVPLGVRSIQPPPPAPASLEFEVKPIAETSQTATFLASIPDPVPLTVSEQLASISTHQLLAEVKRRLGIRLRSIIRDNSFLYKSIHFFYAKLLKPTYFYTKKMFVHP